MDNGWCIWFTGLPCSGKTTLANALLKELEARDVYTAIRLDGDITRQTVGKDLGFSPEDRNINIERIIGVATYLTHIDKVNVICSYISPYEHIRNKVRELIPRSLIVHVDAPHTVCAERDVKGMWVKAMNGEIKDFTGVDAPYEEPINPDIVLKTNHWDVDFCISALVAIMQERGFICGD